MGIAFVKQKFPDSRILFIIQEDSTSNKRM